MRPSRTEASVSSASRTVRNSWRVAGAIASSERRRFEGGHQRFPGAVFRVAEARDRAGPEPTSELAVAPFDPVGPWLGVGRATQPLAQVGDELEERRGDFAPSVGPGQPPEPAFPVVVAAEPGDTAHPLPLACAERATFVVAHRQVGEELEHGAPLQATPVEAQELEEEAWGDAFDEFGSARAVPCDAVGGEMVLDESCVGGLGGPEHGDPLEGDGFAREDASSCVDDGANSDAHLVVSVGDGHDLCRGCRRGRQASGWRIGDELSREPAGLGVGRFIARGDGHDRDAASGGQFRNEASCCVLVRVGEVQHDVVQPRNRLGAQPLGCTGEQVGLVVPLAPQHAGDGIADANGLAPAAASGEPFAALLAGKAQLLVELAEGHDGCGMMGDGPVDARSFVEHLTDGEVEQRRGYRSTLGVGECRAGEQLGEPVERDHVDTENPRLPAETAAGHDAGDVGRDDHGDRSETVTALGLLDRRCQCCEHVGRRAT